MQELADASGVSRRMLSMIELGGGNPSLVTVGKIAHALGTDFPSLARDSPPGSALISAAGQSTPVWSTPTGSRASLVVASTLQPPAEVFEWVLAPGDAYIAEPDPPGSEELFLVLEGHLTLEVEGRSLPPLTAGASARLASDTKYAYRNHGAVEVRFIRVAHVKAAGSR